VWAAIPGNRTSGEEANFKGYSEAYGKLRTYNTAFNMFIR